MPTLQQVLNQLQGLDGYIYHRQRAEDHQGMVKIFTVWMTKNGEMRDYEVRILVIDGGQPTEAAYVYSYKHLLNPTNFRIEIEAELPSFLATNMDIHRAVIHTVDEDQEMGIINTYSYDSGADTVTQGQAIAFKRQGSCIIKRLITSGAYPS